MTTPMRVLILGGSGFVGGAVAGQLVKQGHYVTVPTRDRERAKSLLLLPSCDVIAANIWDDAVLEAEIARHDVVINLVGILSGDFERVHVTLPKLVAEHCARHGKRLLHMSALCADADGGSGYLRSRGRGEDAVHAIARQTGLAVTMFRPSVIFGEGDNFINMLARLVRLFPVIPLGSPDARFQPVWVEDVARAIVVAMQRPETIGQTYELVGPQVFTLRELLTWVMHTIGRPRPVVPLGSGLAMLQAMAFEFPPGKWLGALLGVEMTRDNVASMRTPNVSSASFPVLFGEAHRLEDVVPTYLAMRFGRAQYNQFRAGR